MRSMVMGIESQSQGHTLDTDRPISFEQDADDVAALLNLLGIEKADVMGFSNGGTTALQVAIRHPKLAGKLVLASAVYKRDGMIAGFFDGFPGATLANMPQPLQDAYLKANPDPKGLQKMFDRDVVRPEHALELARSLPQGRVAILPCGHDQLSGTHSNPAPFLTTRPKPGQPR